MRVIGRRVLVLPEATDLDHLLILVLVALHHDGQSLQVSVARPQAREMAAAARALIGALARQTPSRPG